jgi:hypothetical protein
MLERVPPRSLATRVSRARIANPYDQDLRAHRPEVVRLFEVLFERVNELFLDVQNAAANLAHGVVVIPAGELVMSGSLAKVRGVNRSRCGQCFE